MSTPGVPKHNLTAIKWLTFLMFMMFAMTTDSVGIIIPKVIEEFRLSMVAAGAFHYANMTAIAVAAIFLGYLADKLGRKKTIILGLVIFALNSYLFAIGNSFPFFLTLLVISGVSIGIFKTGALALVGDISISTSEHTNTMNTVEGFFGVGAIIGPAIVARLLASGFSWKWLYAIAGTICVLLIATASVVKYPKTVKTVDEPIDFKRTMRMMNNTYALGFSLGIFLYVAAECAVYVWMPTLLTGYSGSFAFMATYAISVFFVLRALGRFLGTWVLNQKLYKPNGALTGANYFYDGVNGWQVIEGAPNRLVTDPQESRALISRSRTLSIGAQSAQGVIDSAVDLHVQFGFFDATSEHSAQWTRSIQTVLPYYIQILDSIAP